MSASVRVILNPLNTSRNSILISLEIHNPVMLLVTTTTVPSGNTTLIVPTTCVGFRF
jgi:hypothetical protein